MAAQPRWLLECDCGMARSFARSSPNGATCVNLGRRPGIHVTHRHIPQTGAHPYPPSMSRIHTHHPCPRCIPTIPVPGAYPPSVFRMHTHHPCPGCIPTVRVSDSSPPSHPQGNALGWYALTLWGKPNPMLTAAQPRRPSDRDCGMARSFTNPCPNGAECDNPGRRPGGHVTHSSAF